MEFISKLTSFAFSLCVVIATAAYGDATPSAMDSPTRFVGASRLGEEFRRQLAGASETVPKAIWQRLQEAGWRFRVAEFVVDAVPSLRGKSPRGWPAGMTWENTDAVYLPQSRLLVFAEKRRTMRGETVYTSRVPGVVRHELGHAVDMALATAGRYRSGESDFIKVYLRDVQALSPRNRERMAYYLQGGAAGRQEAFAEAFGILLGGGSDVDKESDFRESFPSVIEFVQRVLDL